MTRIALVLAGFFWLAGCTAKEARHDGDVFLNDVGKTTSFLMDPTQSQDPMGSYPR